MSVSETDRLELHQAIRGVIGVRPAEIFMECIIPRDWDSVVRVDQFNAFHAEMRAEFADLRAEFEILRGDVTQENSSLRAEFAALRADVTQENSSLRAEFADLRAEFEILRANVTSQIAELRAEMKQGFAELRLEFGTQLERSLRRQTQFMLGFMGTLTLSMIVALLR